MSAALLTARSSIGWDLTAVDGRNPRIYSVHLLGNGGEFELHAGPPRSGAEDDRQSGDLEPLTCPVGHVGLPIPRSLKTKKAPRSVSEREACGEQTVWNFGASCYFFNLLPVFLRVKRFLHKDG